MTKNLYRTDYLKQLCQEYKISPSKQYGQHYLISDAPIRKMIEAADLKLDDTVVEIGPGFGVLTLAVAPLVKKVVAFEIEQKLKSYWEEKMKEHPNIKIIWGNALHLLPLLGKEGTLRPQSEAGVVDAAGNEAFHEPSYDSTTPPAYGRGAPPFQGGENYKVLANLPYGITSDILRLLLEAKPKPEKIVVMVQKEVGERICAVPPDMSLLSVAVRYYGEPKIVTKVPSGSFWPRPKVESVVVVVDMKTRKQESTENTENTESTENTENKKIQKTLDDTKFFKIVRTGFSHKRKQLWSNLANGLHLPSDKVKAVLFEVTGNEKIRAEELSMEQWLMIVNELTR